MLTDSDIQTMLDDLGSSKDDGFSPVDLQSYRWRAALLELQRHRAMNQLNQIPLEVSGLGVECSKPCTTLREELEHSLKMAKHLMDARDVHIEKLETRTNESGLTTKECIEAAANFGIDLSCGECAQRFFTGWVTNECPPDCKTIESLRMSKPLTSTGLRCCMTPV